MIKPEKPLDEASRLSCLQSYDLLDTSSEIEFDKLVLIASKVIKVPIALVSIVDSDRQWFKSKVGLEVPETPRDISFCAYTILQDDIFIVEDSTKDKRFADNPLVVGEPRVIFYAGVPLKMPSGHNIGTLCLIDSKPRKLSIEQIEILKLLGDEIVILFEKRKERLANSKMALIFEKLHALNFEENSLDVMLGTYLKTGTELLGLDFGIVSSIEGQDYSVKAVYCPNQEFKLGENMSLSNTFCQAVVDTGQTITYEEVGQIERMKNSSFYLRGKIESYISTPIWIDGNLYGTLNYFSTVVKKNKFTFSERKFVEVLSKNIAKKIKLDEVQTQAKFAYDIIEATPAIIGLASFKTNKIIYHNHAFEKISGTTSDGKFIKSFHPDWAFKIVKEEGIPYAIKHGKWTGETSILNEYGVEVPVLQTIVTHKDDKGEIQYTSTIMNDITKIKKYEREIIQAKEEALQASEAKSTFLATMSHEIRTPMNGILGMSTILRESMKKPEHIKQLETIIECGDSLLELIDAILDVTKLEAGKFEIEEVEFSFQHVLKSTVALFQTQVNLNKNTISYNIDHNLFDILIGDIGKIRQVINNLIGNAIKFTHEGMITVKVSSNDNPGDMKEFIVEVIDTGIGISKENQSKIFSEFTQADTSTKRIYGGTGLGLSISLQFAVLLGGSLSVESEVGKGSKFIFKFMSKISNLKKISSGHKSLVNLDFAKQFPMKILVVDDNEINRIVAVKMLGMLGYESSVVNSGFEAIDLLSKENFDLILMDNHMPKMDGLETSRKILKNDKKVIIVAFSASAQKEDIENAKKVGVNYFLSKPIKIEMIVQLITTIYSK